MWMSELETAQLAAWIELQSNNSLSAFMAYGNIHPSTHSFMHCTAHSAKLSGRLHILCIHKVSTAHRVLPASSLLRFPIFSLPLHVSVFFFSLFVSLPPTPLERQQPDVAGEKTDGNDDRRNFFFGPKWKSEDMKWMNPPKTHMQAHMFQCSTSLFACVNQLHKHPSCLHIHTDSLSISLTHTHSPYAPHNQPFQCFGLEADGQAGEYDSL